VGSKVQIRMTNPGEVEYTFPCSVQWVALESDNGGMGLTFTGIPLEIRYDKDLRATA
jgi:hypothetical protein